LFTASVAAVPAATLTTRRSELAALTETVLASPATEPAPSATLFARLNADRNGVPTPGEFAALVQDPGNRDQVITMVEYRAATLANVDRLDTDKDGVRTGAEINAVPPHAVGR
jgi:hypothetical protein